MSNISKVKKLPSGEYKVEKTLLSSKQISIVNKLALENAIKILEKDIAERNNQLVEKKNLLKEINKIS